MGTLIELPIDVDKPGAEIAPGWVESLRSSSIGSYMRCPRQFWYEYVAKIRAPRSGALITGTAMHEAADQAMTEKLLGNEAPTIDDCADIARDSALEGLDEQQAEVEATGLTDHLKKAAHPDDVVDKAVDLARHWREESCDSVEPVAVEKHYVVSFGGYRVSGTLDVIDTTGQVVDWKTSGKKPSDKYSEGRVQSYLYPALAGADMVTYIVHTHQVRAGMSRKELVADYGNETCVRWSTDLTVNVARGVRAGSFPRNTDHIFGCASCPFKQRCWSGVDDDLVEQTADAIVSACQQQ